MPQLFIYPKKGGVSKFSVGAKKVCMGRSTTNDLVLDDQFSSGCHAIIVPTDRGYVLQDQGSKNGTFLNGRRITADVHLAKGDEILIGSTKILFDREYQTNVQMVEGTTFTHSSNTIIQVQDILKKPPTAFSAKTPGGGLDLAMIEHDQKFSAFLIEVSQALIYHMDINPLLEHIMDVTIHHIPMDRGVLMLKEGSAGELVPKVVRVQTGALKTQNIRVSQSIVRTAIERNSAVLISDIQSDEQLRGQVSVVQAQIHSAMCVPLWNGTEIIGLIYADRTAVLGQFTEDDLRRLTLLANLAAVKYENALLYSEALKQAQLKRDIDLAVQIQHNFLPKADPVFEPYDISGAARACAHVGGDYYDFIPIDASRLGLVIADVSGKGVSAALLMSALRASLHAEITVTKGLGGLAAKLNNFVHGSTDTDAHSFISFFFGILDRQDGSLAYVNAGHNPPILLGSGGPKFLESTGFCLGMFPSVSYETQSFTFEPGEILCLYTDGIVESRNLDKEEFGLERLTKTLRKSAGLPARDIKENVFLDVFGFTECADAGDDMTLMIVKRKVE